MQVRFSDFFCIKTFLKFYRIFNLMDKIFGQILSIFFVKFGKNERNLAVLFSGVFFKHFRITRNYFFAFFGEFSSFRNSWKFLGFWVIFNIIRFFRFYFIWNYNIIPIKFNNYNGINYYFLGSADVFTEVDRIVFFKFSAFFLRFT